LINNIFFINEKQVKRVFLYKHISNQTSPLPEQELIKFIHYLFGNFVEIHQYSLFHVNLKLENVLNQKNKSDLTNFTFY
jgi:hypothetical protein